MPHTPAMIIIGAGHCGGRAALKLRELGWMGSIHLIGDERHLPYERPSLSKGVLLSEVSAESCHLLDAPGWAEATITLHQARVLALDTTERTVHLDNGTLLRYQSLLLATGGYPRVLTIPGGDHPEVLMLRNWDDAHKLQAMLASQRCLLVVGGGFIGLEVAASAKKLGCDVTLLEGGPRLMGRAVTELTAQKALAMHRSKGIDVRLNTLPTRLTRTDTGWHVMLSDGSHLLADLVVAGIGIVPATDLAAQAGLSIGRGIRVNAELQTSDPHIWAAGDVVEFPSVVTGDWVRQETWLNAETQAECAARNMLGEHRPYATLPWFWSDQFEYQIQVSGEPAASTQSVLRDLGEGDHLMFYLNADNQLVGMAAWGLSERCAKEFKLARALVERCVKAAPAALSDPQTKLKALLKG